MAKKNKEEPELIGFGNKLIGWEVDEYDRHERGLRWYILATIIGVALIVYAIMTSNFLFAVIILMIGVIIFLSSIREPHRIQVQITDNGIVIGQTFHPYKTIKDFAIVYDPPEVKVLYLDFFSVWRPLMSIPLEDTDPNTVRDALLPYCIENLERTEESLTDLVSRLYKL